MRHVSWWHAALSQRRVTGSPYPSLRQILLLVFVAVPVAQLLMYPVFGPGDLVGLVVLELFLLWLAALALRLRRSVPEDVLLFNATPLQALWLTLPAAVGAALIVAEVDHLLAAGLRALSWAPPLAIEHVLTQLQLVDDLPSLLGVSLGVVLVPAVCEEVFFRGFVFTGLRYHHGPATAIVGSALLFAAAHMNPWQFPALFLLGLFLAALVHWTHSVWPAVIGHSINNGLSVIAVNVRTHTGVDVLGASDPLPPIVVLFGGVALIMGVRLLRRLSPIMPILSPFARPAPADGPAEAWH